jgi:hypothetical protein
MPDEMGGLAAPDDPLIPPPYRAPGQDSTAAKIGAAILTGPLRAAMYPGKVWSGEANPYEGDEATDWATGTALGMIARGASSTPPGALGTGGSRIVQPTPMGELAAPTGIRAYHGSPRDFDRFDISQVGSRPDAGGSTFGKGLYFADDPRSAEIYRDTGKVYEVNLRVKPDELMQWSSIQQSPLVRNAVANLPTPELRSGQPFGRGAKFVEDPEGRWILDTGNTRFPMSYRDMDRLFGLSGGELTGGQIYRRAASELGDDAVMRKLQNAGVKGVQYPDEHRYTGSNYAIYDDKLIDILRKYGFAGIAPPVLGALAAPDQRE